MVSHSKFKRTRPRLGGFRVYLFSPPLSPHIWTTQPSQCPNLVYCETHTTPTLKKDYFGRELQPPPTSVQTRREGKYYQKCTHTFPEYFQGKHFYLLEGDMEPNPLKRLTQHLRAKTEILKELFFCIPDFWVDSRGETYSKSLSFF